MVLTILADGGSGQRCQVTTGNKEICLEDEEALEFLWKEEIRTERNKEVDRKGKSLAALKFSLLSFPSERGKHHRRRRRERACCFCVRGAKNHTS